MLKKVENSQETMSCYKFCGMLINIFRYLHRNSDFSLMNLANLANKKWVNSAVTAVFMQLCKEHQRLAFFFCLQVVAWTTQKQTHYSTTQKQFFPGFLNLFILNTYQTFFLLIYNRNNDKNFGEMITSIILFFVHKIKLKFTIHV